MASLKCDKSATIVVNGHRMLTESALNIRYNLGADIFYVHFCENS